MEDSQIKHGISSAVHEGHCHGVGGSRASAGMRHPLWNVRAHVLHLIHLPTE